MEAGAFGNAYPHEPGLLLYITGEKPEDLTTTTMGARGGGTATALRVVFVLLCKPDLLNAPYRNIVEAANVALGAIGWVFFDLEKRGYVAGGQKKNNRRFLEPTRLFEEWVMNYPIKLRPKLNPRRFRAENPEWWKHADLAGLHGYWGGEVAAHRLTKYLKPATCTLYIEPKRDDGQHAKALAKVITANRLRADTQGDIEILDAFWDLPQTADYPDVVPPILAYADLIVTLDPRNIEVAKLPIPQLFNSDVLVFSLNNAVTSFSLRAERIASQESPAPCSYGSLAFAVSVFSRLACERRRSAQAASPSW